MRGKQAKILSDDNLADLLLVAETSRHPLRNKVMVLLSAKAGLRAAEIARLTWAMVTDPTGDLGTVLELPDRAAKNRSGRVIPLHEDLRCCSSDIERRVRGYAAAHLAAFRANTFNSSIRSPRNARTFSVAFRRRNLTVIARSSSVSGSQPIIAIAAGAHVEN
jgi:integrase